MKLMKTNKMSRRSFLAGSASVIGSALVPESLYARRRGSERLNIGYLPITDAAPLLIAHSQGYFADEGLDVPRPVMVRSWTVLTESFVGRKFDLTHMLFPIPVWMRFKKKFPVKVLCWDHTNGSAVTVHGDSDIRGFADLGGKQIAVPSWYSMHNFLIQMGILARGLKPVIKPLNMPVKMDEVNLFVLQPSEMPLALLGKKMDGFIVAEPFNALAEIKFNARIMRFTGDIWKNHPCCVLVGRESLIHSRPVVVQKAVNAVVRAQIWCTENPEKAARILGLEGKRYLPVSESVLKRVFTGYDLKSYHDGPGPKPIMHPGWNISRIGFQPYPFPSATRFIISQMAITSFEGDAGFLKLLNPSKAAKELVDDSFVKNALDNLNAYGFFYPQDIRPSLLREEIIEIG